MEAHLCKDLKKIRKEAPRRLKSLITICDELIGHIYSFILIIIL